ncbi:MAG: branched-chain amino acid aminotransferase [Eubacteriales bacterium]|nr:branched-chain amino acid aminotransferase [Eubacteriales bacterium]
MSFPTIAVTRATQPKTKPLADAALGFGQIFTDHMFSMDYIEGQGWIDPRIEPYAPISLDPSAMVFHYGQAIFEGLKAYKAADGSINLFRPQLNFARVNQSNARMVIPAIDEAFCLYALEELLKIEKDWIPTQAGSSLYIRPFIIATDPYLGVRPAHTYRFMIILSPSGNYYPQGLNPVNIYVEEEYVRAVKGGTGYAKTPGNYAASLIAQAKAYKAGYVQVLWLDGVHRRFIEEVGSMNVFFVIDGKVVTPAINGSILPGITRRTVLELAKKLGLETEEREIAIDEIAELAKTGRVSEVFGAGTAAVISPVGELRYKELVMNFNDGKIGPLSQQFYDIITGVQYGRLKDDYGWIVKI